MARKILNKLSPGSATEFGADDTDYINKLLTGVDQSATDPVDISTQWRFRDNKLYLRNPANTFAYIVRTAALTANREIWLPLMTGTDTVVLNDFPATLSNKILAAPRITNYLDYETATTPSNPASGKIRLYREPSTNVLTLRKSDGTIIPLEGLGATAHKTTHVSGGDDAFAKADVLVARARYLEDVVDPTSDNTRVWIENATPNLKYWDDQGTPAKHTVEIQTNRGTANGYCELDSNGNVPASKLGSVDTSKVYMPRWGTRVPFGHTISTATGGYGLWNGIITSTGTHSFQTLGTGVRTDWITGTTAGNQAGFRTNILHLERQQDFRIRIRFRLEETTATKGFIGVVSDAGGFRPGTDPLNTRHGVGIHWDTTTSANFRIAHNDNIGATTFSDWSTPTAIDTISHVVEIDADDPEVRFQMHIDSLAVSNITTNIPNATSELAFQCFNETSDTSAKNLHTAYIEGETVYT